MFSNLAGLQFFTPLFSFSSSYQGGFEREERWREGWTGNLLLRQHLSTVPNTKTERGEGDYKYMPDKVLILLSVNL